MSDTPRTDAALESTWGSINVPTNPIPADFARQLERELAEVTKQRDRLAEAITHCVLRIKDYEKYLAGTRSNPPSSSAALEFAEKAIAATKGGAA